MSNQEISDEELTAYLDEQLPAERMTEVEKTLRSSESLRLRTAQLARSRDQGVHSVGDIWRRARISCPSRSELGEYLLQTLSTEESDYIKFHLQTVGCRYCAANFQDLQESLDQNVAPEQRRRKFFESSAGQLRKLRDSND